MTTSRLSGIATPVLTPYNDDGSIALDLYGAHCAWVLAQGSHYISPFGTTGEALSVSLDERMRALESLVSGASIAPEKIIPGSGLCSMPETIELTRHAVNLGCAAVLVLPPFFYVQASDEGLYRYFSELIEKTGSADLRICLYHIPPQAGIGFSPELAHRLNQAFPGIVVAIKDSSGDWDNTRRLFEIAPDLAIFPGSETFLLQGLQNGGAGCISATCNINAGKIRQVFDLFHTDSQPGLEAANEEMKAFRLIVQAAGPIPAMKAILAASTGDARWKNIRAPLLPISDAKREQLLQALDSQLEHLGAGSGRE